MHGRIYQISKKQISSDEFINEATIDCNGGWESWADYISDNLREELAEEYKKFPFLDGKWKMFELNGDCLTYLGDEDVIKVWERQIREAYNKLIEVSVAKDHLRFKLKTAIDGMHTFAKFYIEDWAEYCNSAAFFISYCHYELKKGDKLYLGNVLNYHY